MVKDEPDLLMWDIMNEPFTNNHRDRASADDKKQREAEITEFDRYYLAYVKNLGPVNAVTVAYIFL